MDYRLKKRESLYDGFFRLDAYYVKHDCFDGGSHEVRREHLERGDAVAALLYDPVCDETLLIEQFRIGPAVRGDEAWLIEIVAGMVDEGESPEAAVRRECLEEAGYAPQHLTHLARYYSTPGGSSERIDLYFAEVDKSKPVHGGGGVDHEHEDIRLRWVGRKEAMRMLADGKINSGAPMLALMMAFGMKGCASAE